MRSRQDLLALSVCLIGIALLVRLQSPGRQTVPAYQVDGFALGVDVAELERRLGPQGQVSREPNGQSWISFGNSHDLAFLINSGFKTFAVRGSSIWRDGREVIAKGAEQAKIEREFGPAPQVADSESGESRRLSYATYGLDLVLWAPYQNNTKWHLQRVTMRVPDP